LGWNVENRLAAVYPPVATGAGASPTPSSSAHKFYLPLVRVVRPVEQYAYDADGMRVKRRVRSEATNTYTDTYYIGAHYEVTTGPTGTQHRKTYLFGGQPLAVREGDGTLTYLHTDHLGSVVLTTNAWGQPLSTPGTRYYAYSAERLAGTPAPTERHHTGQRLDRGTGLLYFQARYYDPALGAWLQPDTIVPEPLRPQTLNRYAYANNSPLTYIDSDGHFAFIPLLIVGGVALLKAIDYGWTAYDSYRPTQIHSSLRRRPGATQAAMRVGKAPRLVA
jgi:RHS repeat-associated protein